MLNSFTNDEAITIIITIKHYAIFVTTNRFILETMGGIWVAFEVERILFKDGILGKQLISLTKCFTFSRGYKMQI